MNSHEESVQAQLEESIRFERLLTDLSARFVGLPAEALDREVEEAQRRISPAKDWTRLVISGGVALKTALLRRLICERLGQTYRLAASEEDILLGLLTLALAFSGRLPSLEAIAVVRKHDHCPT